MSSGLRNKVLILGLGVCLATSAGVAQAMTGHRPAAPAPAAAATAVTAADAVARTPAAAATASHPAVFFGTWFVPGQAETVAEFSAASGHLLRLLAPPEPGGGDGQIALGPRSRTVAFTALDGTCAASIESAATAGGPVRILVPYRPQHGGTLAYGPSYSADGRFFSYQTRYCDSGATFLHIQNLRTGATSVRQTTIGGLIFIDDDHRAVDAGGETPRLTVVSLPSLATRTYRAPAGCRFDGAAGTQTRLVAALDCGSRRALSVVSLSASTFRVTATLARLGSCLQNASLSLGADGAVVLEADRGCQLSPTAIPRAELVEIYAGRARVVLSGKATALPGDPVW
jgi:hypothetical protein